MSSLLFSKKEIFLIANFQEVEIEELEICNNSIAATLNFSAMTKTIQNSNFLRIILTLSALVCHKLKKRMLKINACISCLKQHEIIDLQEPKVFEIAVFLHIGAIS